MENRFLERWHSFYGQLVDQNTLDLTLRLTLILIIVRPGSFWYLIIIMTLLAICPFIYRPLLPNRNYWLVMAGILLFVNNFYYWNFSDNHKFLISYWCLAIGCSLSLEDPEEAMVRNARWLVGLVFLFATLWKATSIVYLNGSAFHFYLLSDQRFFALAHLFGGIDSGTILLNEMAIAKMATLPPLIQLRSPPGVATLAHFLTWWTIISEGIIALLFLIPRWSLSRWRDIVLLLFMAGTYPPTNVTQFGWILTIMGLAQCPREARRTRFCYLLVFLYIFCFSSGYLRKVFYDWIGLPQH